jgi:hypothetical protein
MFYGNLNRTLVRSGEKYQIRPKSDGTCFNQSNYGYNNWSLDERCDKEAASRLGDAIFEQDGSKQKGVTACPITP